MYKTKAVKNVKSSKFTFCNSLQTEIVRQVEFHTFAWSFLVYNTESESKISVQRNSAELWLIKTHKFFHMTSRKQTVQSECFMNERQPNSPGNMKIVQDDSAIKLGCSDWCGLPINASGRMSEQALIFSLEGRQMKFLWLASVVTAMTEDGHDKRAAMDLTMIAVALTPSWLVWILTVMPVWLYFSSFLFCFWTRNFIHYTSVGCVWFSLSYVSLQSNWAWKPLKLGLSISFSLWGFSSLLTL